MAKTSAQRTTAAANAAGIDLAGESAASLYGVMVDRLDRYPGGKNAAGTFQWLISLMPTHAVYVEGCVGSGGLFRRKVPALTSVLIDSDTRIAEYWRRRDVPGSVALCGDVVPWLQSHADRMDEDWLIYLDPPYRLDTRSHKRLYAEEWPAAKHNQLLEVVRSLPARVMLSGYSTPEYSLALGDWYRETRSVITRGGVMRDEVIWCNFQPGATDAPGEWDGPYPGENFRERERIKKKLRRWRRLLLEMPDYEQRAFLLQLLNVKAASLAANIDAAGSIVTQSGTGSADPHAGSGDEVLPAAHVDGGRQRRPRRCRPSGNNAAAGDGRGKR